MPIAEMQARVFFATLTGQAPLPSNSEMRLDVLERRTRMQKQYYGSPRHTLQCNYMDMMDELATIIGCRPEFWPTLLQDPVLALRQTFGPCAPYVYRTTGPHKWEGAREAIMDLPKRIEVGFRQGAIPAEVLSSEPSSLRNSLLYVLVLAILAYFLL